MYMGTGKELNISRVLRRHLDRDEITIRALSSELQIPMSTLFNYLVNRMPRNPQHIRKICDYFSITADELLFDICPPTFRDIKKGDLISGKFRVISLEDVDTKDIE